MKKIVFLLSALFWPLAALAGGTDEGFYTRFDIGGVYGTGNEFSRGVSAQTGFGQAWGGFLRSEFTLEYTRARVKGRDAFDSSMPSVRTRLPSVAAMTTMYADLFSFKGVTPYAGIGGGVTRNKLPDLQADGRTVFGDRSYKLAWKAVGGVGIELPKNLVLDIGYVYTDLGRFSGVDINGVSLHQKVVIRKVMTGLRYNF